jgi:hypothetical protein
MKLVPKIGFDLRLALSLFVTTVYPNYFWFWVPAVTLFLFCGPGFKFYSEDKFLFAFLVGVFFLTLLGAVFSSDSRPWSPVPFGYSLLLLCVLVGRWINEAVLRWLLLFITFEALVCVVQILSGRPYVFTGQLEAIHDSGETEWGSVDLLYFNRAYGLSTNSSTAAQKFLIGFMIVSEISIRRAWSVIAAIGLVAGMYCTFNRTAMISAICFGSLIFLKEMFGSLNRKKIALLIIFCSTVIILLFNWESVVNQFMRGRSDKTIFDEAGRQIFFVSGIDFFKSNLLFGNFSQRFEVIEAGVSLHLHNSWLQVLADHGLIGMLIIIHAFSLLRLKNLPFFVTFSVYSCMQYGIFSKISLINVMFYFFMRNVSSIRKLAKEHI